MNVAFIPVRGGSKSIPLKNIKPICGKPLVYWVIKAAYECGFIDKIYVSTDSDLIKKTVEQFGFDKLKIIGRSVEVSSDTASTESVMLEFASKYDFDNVVLIQATSPLLNVDDLNRGFRIYNKDGVDSVISVVRQKRFNWTIRNDGFTEAINYDVFHRPRRQEFNGYYVENGAFYICSKKSLLETKNRISGNIAPVEMDGDTFFEIDEPSDWVIIEALMKKKGMNGELPVVPEIKMFLTDCDGCLTDGGMYYTEKGDEIKKFNTKDGMAFQLLREKGIIVGIITGENTEINRRRVEKLHLDILEQGCKDKLSKINELCRRYNIDIKNVAYIGDDINDIDAVKTVGFGCCPADSVKELTDVALYKSNLNGGDGVIRDIAEIILSKR